MVWCCELLNVDCLRHCAENKWAILVQTRRETREMWSQVCLILHSLDSLDFLRNSKPVLRSGSDSTHCFSIPCDVINLFKELKMEPFCSLLSQSQLKNLTDDKHGIGSSWRHDKEGSSSSMEIDLEKQLDMWRENPSWTDQIPVVKVNKRLHFTTWSYQSQWESCFMTDNNKILCRWVFQKDRFAISKPRWMLVYLLMQSITLWLTLTIEESSKISRYVLYVSCSL